MHHVTLNSFQGSLNLSLVGLCACFDQNCTKYKCLCLRFCGLLNWPKQKLYKLYFDPYAKFEDPAFDNFHFMEALTNETYPISWFLNLNGGGDDKYFTFSFVKGKYCMYILFLMVQEIYNLSPR
jgi:hypothetical protein